MADYFALFDLPQTFALDARALDQRYFALQREHHPDRLIGLPPLERARRIQLSADVNEGYRVLKSSLARAQHLLALQGIWVNSEQDTLKPSQSLLLEVMEWREALAEADSNAARQVILAEVSAAREKTLAWLSDCFIEARWDEAAQGTLRLNYVTKLLEDMRRG